MRKNNIECRKCTPNTYYKFEIVKWYKNPYYGKEADYDYNFHDYKPKNTIGVYISESCFKNIENCYVIAHLIKIKYEYDLKTVGDRFLDLNDEELVDFLTVYKNKVKWKNNG